jgi:hypothetical protein
MRQRQVIEFRMIDQPRASAGATAPQSFGLPFQAVAAEARKKLVGRLHVLEQILNIVTLC